MIKDKKIAILVEEDFEDAELMEPMRVMEDAGAEVVLIGNIANKVYHGKRGKEAVTSDTTADKVIPTDFDAIIIPGGYAPDKMRLHSTMIDLVKRAYEAGKIVAAVCHGPQMLISAGIAKGHRLTSWPSVAIDLENAGATWVDEAVVKDGNIITSRKPADLAQFSQAIISNLSQAKQGAPA